MSKFEEAQSFCRSCHDESRKLQDIAEENVRQLVKGFCEFAQIPFEKISFTKDHKFVPLHNAVWFDEDVEFYLFELSLSFFDSRDTRTYLNYSSKFEFYLKEEGGIIIGANWFKAEEWCTVNFSTQEGVDVFYTKIWNRILEDIQVPLEQRKGH